MTTITDYFAQAQLSMAAYASLQSGMFGKDYPGYVAALVDKGMSQKQAELFATTYAVIDQYTDPATGLSATLFSKAGVNYFAIRGTEAGVFSGALDWLTNVADVDAEGIAVQQGLALFNYLQRLQGAAGNPVVQYSYNPVTKTLGTYTGTASGLLSGQTTPMTVTGHSLGGQLAMIMSRLVPGMVSAVYTYNAPGFDTTLRTTLFPLTSEGFFNALRNVPIGPITGQIGTSWNSGIMSHLDVAGDVVHTIGNTPGTSQIIFSESANQGVVDAHSIQPITDSLALYNLYATLAPSVPVATVTNIFNASSFTTNGLLRNDATLETALDGLRTLFQNYASATPTTNLAFGTGTLVNNRDDYYTKLQALQTYLKTTPFYNATTQSLGLSVNTLTASPGSLAGSAQTDIATRYALYKLNPFTVSGAGLYATINTDRALDLYNPTTRTGSLTNEYLNDRPPSSSTRSPPIKKTTHPPAPPGCSTPATRNTSKTAAASHPITSTSALTAA